MMLQDEEKKRKQRKMNDGLCNQNRDIRDKRPKCKPPLLPLGLCLQPRTTQAPAPVKTISPGERKHTPINCSERDFSKALDIQLVLIHIDFNKIFLGQW